MATTPTASNQWLIRTQKNMIGGPLPKERLIQLIHEGKLGPQDEVCRAHSYWIYLHEDEEVMAQLGIHSPRGTSPGDEEEITETETRSDVFPQHPEPSADFDPEQTAFISRKSRTEQPQIVQKPSETEPAAAPVIRQAGFVAPSADPSHRAAPLVEVVGGKIEQKTIWGGLAWLLLFAAIGVLFAVMKVLSENP